MRRGGQLSPASGSRNFSFSHDSLPAAGLAAPRLTGASQTSTPLLPSTPGLGKSVWGTQFLDLAIFFFFPQLW